jgi:tetratricopeptide (TPR) repeat protein
VENRNILIGLGTGLVAGLVAGIGIGYYFGTNEGHAQPAAAPAAMAAPAAPMADPALQAQMTAVTQIPVIKAELDKDPRNAEGWVSLGNAYFDSRQPQLAVDAYAKALALDPKGAKNPDILTDQGVMYRDLKAFDKAIADFKRANQLNPTHLQSLLNLGIVEGTDLHDKVEARKAMHRIIEIAPASPQAEQARQFLAGL